MRPRRHAAWLALGAAVVAGVVATAPTPAFAADPPGAGATPPAPATLKVAVAPLVGLAEGGPDLAPVHALVVTGLASLPGVIVVSDRDVRAAVKKAKRKELEHCDGQPGCLAELGKLVGVQVVVAGDVGDLGGGQVAYLVAVDVATAKELGSTTAVLSGDPATRAREARAAGVRLLMPAAYVGRLAVSIDVTGAVIYVDGKQVGRSPAAPAVLGVGTHALRVTHEKYRDFVRFVDVSYDETTKLDVNLKEFPVVADDMVQTRGRPARPKGPVAPRPWYRRGWVVAAAAGGLFIVTAVTAGTLASGVDADSETTVK